MKELVAKLHCGELSCSDVLSAYVNRALNVHKRINCVTNVSNWRLNVRIKHYSNDVALQFFPESFEYAEKLDLIPLKDRAKYPLFGVPISLKECFKVKGHDSTLGLTKFLNNPAKDDCEAVRHLRSLGAIPFCHTNLAHALSSLECSNPAFGKTSNPFNGAKDAGGSSGGEAALGSLLGVGNDIGGSLRNPAAMCGVYSLRPTYGRHLSQIGVRFPDDSVSGQTPGLVAVGGFMSNAVEPLIEASKAVWNHSSTSKDPNSLPLKWNEELFIRRKLKVATFAKADPYYEPHPGCKRALKEAIEVLKGKNYEVIELEGDDDPREKLLNLFFGLMLYDNGQDLARILSEEPPDSSTKAIALNATILNCPKFIQKIIQKAASFVTTLPMPEPRITAKEIHEALEEKEAIFVAFSEKMRKLNVDAILCVGSLIPAPEKGTHGDLPAASFPYLPWSVLDLPAGIAPVTNVHQTDNDANIWPPNNDLVYKMMKSSLKDSTLGLPLAVQIVATKKYEEEVVLQLMSAVKND